MAPPSGKREQSLQRHMVRGSVWTISMRWSIRLAGLIGTVILARLLTPADYGIVSIASMIVGIVEVFGRAGQASAIVRHPNPTREHYDSAWTVSLLLGLGLGLLIWAMVPLTTAYFHEPRAKLVVEILAFRTMLSGSQNIAVLNFQRNLQFNRQFWFSITPEFVAFVVTVIAAFALRNYWALVIGIMSQHVTNFTLSYAMEPYRPRICFSKVREIWSFSIWTLLRNIASYFNLLVDRVAIGGFAGSAGMGRYYVATDLATSPSQELVAPIVGVMFPVMATVQNDVRKRRELYLDVLYWSALICSSTAIGVALVANDMVDLVLGPKWQDVKPLMPWLALSYGILGLGSSVYTALETIGQPRLSAQMQWMRLLGMALVIIPYAFFFRDIHGVAVMRFAVSIAVMPTLFFVLSRPFDLSFRDFVATLWRPFVSGLAMVPVVLGINSTIAVSGNPRLFLDIAAGGATYLGMTMLLWFLTGKPRGPELQVWQRISRKLPAPAG